MSTQEQNFWLTTAEAPQVPVRELQQSVHVAVIGGGFTGLSAARAYTDAAIDEAWRAVQELPAITGPYQR